MKKAFLSIVTFLIATASFAQWTTNGNNVTIDKNIGIGTTTPSVKLDVNGDAYISNRLKLGSIIPAGSGWKISYLDFEGNTLRLNPIRSGYLTAIDFIPGINSEELANTQMNFYTSDKNSKNTKKVMINAEGATFFNGGNIGVGTENPTHKLEVNGDAYISDRLKLGSVIPAGSSWKTSYLDFEGSTLRLNPVRSGYLTAIDFVPGINSEELANTQMNFYISDKNSKSTKKVMINADGTTFFNGGNVGIGTDNPSVKLDVNGDAYISQRLKLGSVMLAGSGWKTSYLDFEGSTLRLNPVRSGYLTAIDFVPGINSEELANTQMNFYISDKNAKSAKKVMINADGITFFNGGNIGIGTDNPIHKLDVNGVIRAKEIKVEIDAGADHVFNTDYDLKPLSEVESFIKENKHLPEIPSEKHMQENGLSMNEFQIKLLQKIEELTLYVINQDKKIEEQSKEIDTLKNIISVK